MPNFHQDHDIIGFGSDSVEPLKRLLGFVGCLVQLGEQQVRSWQIRLELDGLQDRGFGLFGVLLGGGNGGKLDQRFMRRITLQVLRIDETECMRQMNFSNEEPLSVLEMVERVLGALATDLEPEVLGEASNEIRDQRLSAARARG